MTLLNLMTEESIEKYFDSVFGLGSERVLADEFQQHFRSLELEECGTLNIWKTRSLATLYRHAGIILFEQENTVEAEAFLEKSVEYFKVVEKGFYRSGTFMYGQNEEAKIYLARCWVRNYRKFDEAFDDLHQFVSMKFGKNQLQTMVNCFNANATLVELILLYKTHLFPGIASLVTKMKSLSDLILTVPCGSRTRRRILTDLYVLEFEFSKYDRTLCESRFSCLSIWCEKDPEFRYLFCKAILRHGKTLVDVISSLVDVYNNVGQYGEAQWNICSFADAYYVIGEKYYEHSNEEAIPSFEKCFTLRREYLGCKHVLTNKALFQLGRSMVQLRPKSLPLHPEGLNLMKKALVNFSCSNSGKFEFNSFALEVLARFLAHSGSVKESAFYYRKCFESSNLSCYRQKIVTAFRKLELAIVFQQYQKWSEAVNVYSSFLAEIPKDNAYSAQIAHCQSLIGYCYFKLGKDSEAENQFRTSRMFYDHSSYDESSSDLQVMTLEMKLLEMEFVHSGMLQKWRADEIYSEVMPKLNFLSQDATDVVWSQLGWYYEEVKDCPSSALDCYRLVLQKRQSVFFHRHPQLCQVLLSLARITLKMGLLHECRSYAAQCIKQVCSLPADCEQCDFYLYSITSIVEIAISRQRNSKTTSFGLFVDKVDRLPTLSFSLSFSFVESFVSFFKKFCDYESATLEEKIPLKGYLLPRNSIIGDPVVV